MRKIFFGYGDFKGYRLQEVPVETLQSLSARYPLKISEHEQSKWKDLFLTIAIHEELSRRASGGKQELHRPGRKELATEMVTKGFHLLSKTYHPDCNGDNETQKRLTLAREFLANVCKEIDDETSEDDISIEEDPFEVTQITDDDIPF